MNGCYIFWSVSQPELIWGLEHFGLYLNLGFWNTRLLSALVLGLTRDVTPVVLYNSQPGPYRVGHLFITFPSNLTCMACKGAWYQSGLDS